MVTAIFDARRGMASLSKRRQSHGRRQKRWSGRPKLLALVTSFWCRRPAGHAARHHRVPTGYTRRLKWRGEERGLAQSPPDRVPFPSAPRGCGERRLSHRLRLEQTASGHLPNQCRAVLEPPGGREHPRDGKAQLQQGAVRQCCEATTTASHHHHRIAHVGPRGCEAAPRPALASGEAPSAPNRRATAAPRHRCEPPGPSPRPSSARGRARQQELPLG